MKTAQRVRTARNVIMVGVLTAFAGCLPLKEKIIKSPEHNKPMPQVVVAKSPEQIQQELKKKVKVFREGFYKRYPSLEEYSMNLSIKFLPDEKLRTMIKKGGSDLHLGGENIGIMVEWKERKPVGYYLALPQSGKVKDHEIASLVAYFAFEGTSPELYFAGNPFTAEFLNETYANLFGNRIEKTKPTEAVLSERALIAFFINQLGEQELLRCYLEGDWNPFMKTFDSVFGKGKFDEMLKFGSSLERFAADYFVKLVREKGDKELIKRIIKTAESFGYGVSSYFGE